MMTRSDSEAGPRPGARRWSKSSAGAVGVVLLGATAGASAATLAEAVYASPLRSPQFTFVDLATGDGITPMTTITDSYEWIYGSTDASSGGYFGDPDTPAGRGQLFGASAPNEYAQISGQYASADYSLTPNSSVSLHFPSFASASATPGSMATVGVNIYGTWWRGNGDDRGSFGVEQFGAFSGTSPGDGSYTPANSNYREIVLTLDNPSTEAIGFSWRYTEDAYAIGGAVVTPPVPEPQTYALMALGLGVVGLWSRRGRRS